jgi:hypothetical protein
VMLPRLSRFLACHNDVIDAGQNNWLFSPCTDILSLSLFTMSYVDKKIDHIFVRNTFLFACDKRRRSRSISVQGENNQLFCPASMTSLWHARKRDRRGSITNRYSRDEESQWKI